MSIECLLCGEKFNLVNGMHLRPVHGITLSEYLEMFPDAEVASIELRQRVSTSQKENWKDLEYAKHMAESRMGNKCALGHVLSEDTRQRIAEEVSRTLTDYYVTHVVSEETLRRQSEAHMGHDVSAEAKQLMSEARRKWFEDPNNVRRMSESCKANWSDSEYVQRCVEGMSKASHRRPNGAELQLQAVLDKYFLGEWEYVGDGRLWVGNKNPDFINTDGKKQVIEVFGVYWHDPMLFPNRLTEDELIAYYKEQDFGCLVFWEYDIWNEVEVVKRVRESFVEVCKG